MRWTILHTISETKPGKRVDEIVDYLLESRQIDVHPPSPLTITPADVGIDRHQLDVTLKRLLKAIQNGESILVYGDYDADGITATAVLWEALHSLGAKAHPFIPHRERHGYGLLVAGVSEAIERHHPSLIITVDNGIVAHEAADYVATQGIDLIITDHHQKGSIPPACLSVVHTDRIAGSGVAWFVAKELNPESARATLELVTVGTIADILPLTGVNRAIVSAGLVALQHTKRPGLRALLAEAGIVPETELTTYHVNFVIAPRLNAMGRLQDAMDSLRLLCTKDTQRAEQLARLLGDTNKTRQDLTQEFIGKGKELVADPSTHLLLVEDDSFHEGVIGLVAGKLAEIFYRPSIVIARGEKVSKASARSVAGVNIIELIRTFDHLLINAGGHPMAAGFTIETQKIAAFREAITQHATTHIPPEQLQPTLRVDCEIDVTDVGDELWKALETLKPFGVGNPQPVLCITGVPVSEVRTMGRENTHLRLRVGGEWTAVGFGMGQRAEEVRAAQALDVAFTIGENVWNGKRELQLVLKDIRL